MPIPAVAGREVAHKGRVDDIIQCRHDHTHHRRHRQSQHQTRHRRFGHFPIFSVERQSLLLTDYLCVTFRVEQRERSGLLLAVAQICHLDGIARVEECNLLHHRGIRVDIHIVDLRQYVAFAEARFLGGALGNDARNVDALRLVELEVRGNLTCHLYHVDTQIAALHNPVAAQVARHLACNIGRNGKGIACVIAVSAGDSGIDANQLGTSIDQCSARVAAVDGSVGLDE